MGLMAGFLSSVAAASRKVGRALAGFMDTVATQFRAAKQKVR